MESTHPNEGTAGRAASSTIHGPKLGIDVGTVRIGVAACDRSELVVLPVQTVRRTQNTGDDIREIAAIAREREVVEIFVGLPKHLAGAEGKSAQMARTFACRLADQLPGIPVRLIDERLSSVSAHTRLTAAGKNSRKQRNVVDQVAAQIILESALDQERYTGRPVGELVRGRNSKGTTAKATH